MNRLIIGLTMLLLPLGAAKGQSLVATKDAIDCGSTGYKMPATAVFELKNNGSRRIVIDDVKADCGCTKVTLAKKDLNAGEKCEIKLIYDGRMLGHYQKQAAVTYHQRHSGSHNSRQTTNRLYLTMTGVVLTEVKDYSGTYPFAMGNLLADKNVLEFDDVNRGDHPEDVINVLNNSLKPMVPNIQHLPPYLTAVSVPEELRPGQAGKVFVTLNSEHIHDFGLTQTSVYLASHLGDKITPDNELPISVVLLPDLKSFEGSNKQYAPRMKFSSESVTIGIVNGKKVKKGVITITNTGRTALNISSMQMFTRGLEVTLGKRQLNPGERTTLKVTGDREQLLKSRSKPRILMITNDPDKSKVIIPINVK